MSTNSLKTQGYKNMPSHAKMNENKIIIIEIIGV